MNPFIQHSIILSILGLTGSFAVALLAFFVAHTYAVNANTNRPYSRASRGLFGLYVVMFFYFLISLVLSIISFFS